MPRYARSCIFIKRALWRVKIGVWLESVDVNHCNSVQEFELFDVLDTLLTVVSDRSHSLTDIAYLLQFHFFDDKRHGHEETRCGDSVIASDEDRIRASRDVVCFFPKRQKLLRTLGTIRFWRPVLHRDDVDLEVFFSGGCRQVDGYDVVMFHRESIDVFERDDGDRVHLGPLIGGPKRTGGLVFGVDLVQRYHDGDAVFFDEPPEVPQGVGHGLLGHDVATRAAETVDLDGVDVGRGAVAGGVASDEDASLDL
jgi:hypothetical protein